MQNVKFIGATVSEIRVFKEEEDEESVKIMFYLYFVPCGINFIQFFACSYFLTMFTTLMSLEDRLN